MEDFEDDDTSHETVKKLNILQAIEMVSSV